MEPPVEIRIDGVPVAQARPRFRNVHTKTGQSFVAAYNPAHVTKWRLQVRLLAQEAMKDRLPMEGPLKMTARVYLPPPKSMSGRLTKMAYQGLLRPTTRPDLDNYAKNFTDGLSGVVFRDDSQIVEMDLSKHYASKPCVMVKVEALSFEADIHETLKSPVKQQRLF